MPAIERMRPLLGTFVTIWAEGNAALASRQVEAAVESAFRAITRVDRLMSFHRCRSDVSRLNRARTGSILRVHAWTFHVLTEAIKLWRWSGGAFDCNVGTALIRAGLLPKMVRGHAHRGRFGDAVRLQRNHSIRLNSRVTLDLGGIAKGFAVDKAVAVMQAHGLVQGLVNAGGDLRVFGEDPQPVWARDPESPSKSRLLGTLANGAVATSGSYFIEDRKSTTVATSAIVDTERGRRVPMAGSVSVIARNCLLADALTKVVVLRGRLPTRLARYAQAKVVAA